MPEPDPIVFFGSGAFGLPTLARLASRGQVALVVSQPDRPAGRGQRPQPTPIAAWALEHALPLVRSDDVGSGEHLARVRQEPARIFVIIAFGQKLPPALIADRMAMNLHGSLLPAWRGAAPIQRAVMEGDSHAGVSVISIAERMDAGVIYATASTPIGSRETAGELHDRLALLGPDVIDEVLRRHAEGSLKGEPQDESRVTRARKLSRSDAWVDFAWPAAKVAARINGLAPWPGCDAEIDGVPVKLLRAEASPPGAEHAATATAPTPGEITAFGRVRCGDGEVELLEVQPAGGRAMSFDSWLRGRRRPTGSAPLRIHSTRRP